MCHSSIPASGALDRMAFGEVSFGLLLLRSGAKIFNTWSNIKLIAGNFGAIFGGKIHEQKTEIERPMYDKPNLVPTGKLRLVLPEAGLIKPNVE